MGLKKIRKIFVDNFTENLIKEDNDKLRYKLIYNLENIEVNFYKAKTEVIKEKNGKIIINISYPVNEEFLVKLIKNKIEFFERKEIKNFDDDKNNDINNINKSNNKKTGNYKLKKNEF